ncbi:MAG: SAM-dependent methyltransferase [Candidatus Odinarchaeota archaeon]
MKRRGKRYYERKNEYYYKKAKDSGYRARSAYKLIQMDERFGLLKKNQFIVDLCGAPGGFSQYIKKKLNGHCQILLVDLEKVEKLEGVTCLQLDITSDDIVEKIRSTVSDMRDDRLPIVDLLVADCSPKVIGRWSTDHARQVFLCEQALTLATSLKARVFVTKVFQGELFESFVTAVKQSYCNIRLHKPKASRKSSAEIYLLAKELLENTENLEMRL